MKTMLAASIAVAVKQAILDAALAAAEAGTITPQTLVEISAQCEQPGDQPPSLAWFEERLPGVTIVVTKQINETVAEVLREFQAKNAQELIAQL